MKVRLSLLYFLQFSIWGFYLTTLGQFLGSGGLGNRIAWFYAAIGVISLVTPSIMGRLADKTGCPEKLLAFCHFSAAVLMMSMWVYGSTHNHLDFIIFYALYLLFLAFYMPTMALANTYSFGLLTQRGFNPVNSFPSIRIWGTVGFVVAMWFVNSAYFYDGKFGFTLSDNGVIGQHRFQYNSMQLFCSGIMGFVTCVFSWLLPSKNEILQNRAKEVNTNNSLKGSLKIIISKKEIVIFLIFVAFSGVCLQISNGFATPYISHFIGIKEYSESFASGNATMLFSLSQISEALCILLVGLSLKYRGIRFVYAIGLFAWALRFLFLGFGNPGDGLWMFIASMLIYGIAFNFITIAGHLHIQNVAPENMKGFAQGLMMFMSNGIGATCGTIIAGSIINHWCQWVMVKVPGVETKMRLFMGDWIIPWMIFSIYALFVMIAWLIFFRPKKQ